MSKAWLGIIVVLVATGCGGVQQAREFQQAEVRHANASEDIDVARRLRKAILSDGSTSDEAQNLYIHCEDGIVTVRGAVANESELARLRVLAQTTHGATRLNDEMVVLTRPLVTQPIVASDGATIH